MEILKKNLGSLIDSLSKKDRGKINDRLIDLISVYPFNEYEYIISNFIGIKKINWMIILKSEKNNLVRNEYLHIFERYGSPTSFGITWAQSHVHSIAPEIKNRRNNCVLVLIMNMISFSSMAKIGLK